MARYITRRKLYRRSRLRRRGGKKISLRKLKKDILKCNFPTKIKFLGLTEKKTMFLTQSGTITGNHSFVLNPLATDNYSTLTGNIVNHCNWDKICILGIYIRIQPTVNTFQGTVKQGTGPDAVEYVGSTITQVQCTYNMNVIDDPSLAEDPINKEEYDNAGIKNKQVFTFNSNESFTIYIPAPSTMSTVDAVIHKPKTWWSLVNLYGGTYKVDHNGRRNVSEDDDEEYGSILPTAQDRPTFTAGRIFFKANTNVSFNYTVNYKVALRG